MPSLREGAVGILPAGALGVSFFYHLTKQLEEIRGDVFFLARAGSSSAEALARHKQLLIADGTGVRRVNAAGLLRPDLLTCAKEGPVPEVLLICPNPDQLLGVITSLVELLEYIYEAGALEQLPFPNVVLSSNGIYF